MKRMMVYLCVLANGRVEEKALPETLIDEEIVRLTKSRPRTQAELAFHDWLVQWRNRNFPKER